MRFACQCSMLQRVAQPVGGQHCCCVHSARPDLAVPAGYGNRGGWAGPHGAGVRLRAFRSGATARERVRCERFRVPDHASFVPALALPRWPSPRPRMRWALSGTRLDVRYLRFYGDLLIEISLKTTLSDSAAVLSSSHFFSRPPSVLGSLPHITRADAPCAKLSGPRHRALGRARPLTHRQCIPSSSRICRMNLSSHACVRARECFSCERL